MINGRQYCVFEKINSVMMIFATLIGRETVNSKWCAALRKSLLWQWEQRRFIDSEKKKKKKSASVRKEEQDCVTRAVRHSKRNLWMSRRFRHWCIKRSLSCRVCSFFQLVGGSTPWLVYCDSFFNLAVSTSFYFKHFLFLSSFYWNFDPPFSENLNSKFDNIIIFWTVGVP